MKEMRKLQGVSNRTWIFALAAALVLFVGVFAASRLAVYASAGDPAISDEVHRVLFAYECDDTDEIKERLATELWARFFKDAPMLGFEEYYDETGSNAADKIAALQAVITYDNVAIPDGTVPVNMSDGTVQDRTVRYFTVTWGTALDENGDDTGEPVTTVVPVIQLDNIEEFLICTDFDDATGLGTQYFSRHAHADTEIFSASSGSSDSEAADWEEYLLIVPSWGNVVAGGNGSQMFYFNTDDMVSFQLNTMEDEFGDYFEAAVGYRGYGALVRVLWEGEVYVTVDGEGETQNIDGMGINSVAMDKVWHLGDDATASVYIGHTTVNLEPQIDTVSITGVTLKDASQRSGVTIDTTDPSKAVLTFSSNCISTVPLTITFSDGTTRDLTLERIGLVIHYQYMDDSNPYTLYCDCYHDPSINVSFDRSDIPEGSLVIYAVYYHPTLYAGKTLSGEDNLYLNIQYASGYHEIIGHTDEDRGFDGYLQAQSGAVATTTFLIGFIPNAGVEGTFVDKWGVAGGFSATVINGGYDDDTTYGGTQIGSGKGVYWNGTYRWY